MLSRLTVYNSEHPGRDDCQRLLGIGRASPDLDKRVIDNTIDPVGATDGTLQETGQPVVVAVIQAPERVAVSCSNAVQEHTVIERHVRSRVGTMVYGHPASPDSASNGGEPLACAWQASAKATFAHSGEGSVAALKAVTRP
jgi:hypothetical protein